VSGGMAKRLGCSVLFGLANGTLKSARNVDRLEGTTTFFGEGNQLSYLQLFRMPRGTKTIQSIVKSILSNTKPYVVPEDPKALR